MTWLYMSVVVRICEWPRASMTTRWYPTSESLERLSDRELYQVVAGATDQACRDGVAQVVELVCADVKARVSLPRPLSCQRFSDLALQPRAKSLLFALTLVEDLSPHSIQDPFGVSFALP
jgi:hypothetical protein